MASVKKVYFWYSQDEASKFGMNIGLLENGSKIKYTTIELSPSHKDEKNILVYVGNVEDFKYVLFKDPTEIVNEVDGEIYEKFNVGCDGEMISDGITLSDIKETKNKSIGVIQRIKRFITEKKLAGKKIKF
jgi:hypothetical protein